MSQPSSKEFLELLAVASLRAMRARGAIAAAQKAVTELLKEKERLLHSTDAQDSSARLAQEKWLLWRQGKLAELNRKHALALSNLRVVQKKSARVIAQEEVIKSLLDRQVQHERQSAAVRSLEAQLDAFTSPGERYQ